MRLLIRAGTNAGWTAERADVKLHGYGNTGNLIFGQSVRDFLSTSENTIEVDGYDPASLSADEVNEKYDALVLPLANAFRPQFEGTLKRYTALIRRLNIPCVVVGVGAQAGLNRAELAGAPMDEWVKDFIAAVLDHSSSIGVRGEFTYSYLKRLGFRAMDIIGCPSLYWRGGDLDIQKRSEILNPEEPIALNHNAGLGTDFDEFIRDGVQSYPNSAVVAQDRLGEYRWSEIAAQLRPQHEAVSVARFVDPYAWVDFMSTRSFSMGSRIHGNISALLAGVPAVVIVHDSRTLELARYHEIPYIMAADVCQFTRIDETFRTADFANFNSGARIRFDIYKTFLSANGLYDNIGNHQNNLSTHSLNSRS